MPSPCKPDAAIDVLIDVLPAGPEATGVLAVLHGACLSPAWTEAMIVGLLATQGGQAWIATIDDRPAGFAMIRQAADEAELLAIGVLPADRGRGIGRTLLAKAIDQCTKAGLAYIYLEVACSNKVARNAYCSMGFVVVGRRPGYYRSAGIEEDAAVMRRDLM